MTNQKGTFFGETPVSTIIISNTHCVASTCTSSGVSSSSKSKIVTVVVVVVAVVVVAAAAAAVTVAVPVVVPAAAKPQQHWYEHVVAVVHMFLVVTTIVHHCSSRIAIVSYSSTLAKPIIFCSSIPIHSKSMPKKFWLTSRELFAVAFALVTVIL